MAQAATGRAAPAETGRRRTKDPIMATTLIGAHTLEHMYGRGFLVLIPAIYVALGLNPITASLIDAVRQLAGGATSMSGGFFVDVFQHRRAQVLTISLVLIGIGYLLVAVAPTYGLILAALAIASAGTAMWHPPALGLLAQRFPARRGLFISMHRSTGNLGDWIGPLIVGVLLGASAGAEWWGSEWWPWEWSVPWRWIVGGGAPIMLTLAAAIFLLLRHVDGPAAPGVDYRAKIKQQLRDMSSSFQGTGMWSIFTVSAVRGMGDRSLLWVIPLYLFQDLGLSYIMVSVHVALISVPGIFTGPLFGALSDRIGRKVITMFIMAATGGHHPGHRAAGRRLGDDGDGVPVRRVHLHRQLDDAGGGHRCSRGQRAGRHFSGADVGQQRLLRGAGVGGGPGCWRIMPAGPRRSTWRPGCISPVSPSRC